MAIPKYDRHGNLKNTSNPEYEGYMVDLIDRNIKDRWIQVQLGERTREQVWAQNTAAWMGRDHWCCPRQGKIDLYV